MGRDRWRCLHHALPSHPQSQTGTPTSAWRSLALPAIAHASRSKQPAGSGKAEEVTLPAGFGSASLLVPAWVRLPWGMGGTDRAHLAQNLRPGLHNHTRQSVRSAVAQVEANAADTLSICHAVRFLLPPHCCHKRSSLRPESITSRCRSCKDRHQSTSPAMMGTLSFAFSCISISARARSFVRSGGADRRARIITRPPPPRIGHAHTIQIKCECEERATSCEVRRPPSLPSICSASHSFCYLPSRGYNSSRPSLTMNATSTSRFATSMKHQRVQAPTASPATSDLLVACQYGAGAKRIQYLLAIGADVHFVNSFGVTALYLAAQSGHVDVVRLLLASTAANVDFARASGATPLFIASHNGHVGVVKELLARNANVDAANANGTTSLTIAAQNGHADVVDALLLAGAQMNLAKTNGVTPLHIAAQNGHIAIVQRLLANGAFVNPADRFSVTPLYIAAQNNHVEVVKTLLSIGAKADLANMNGVTPLSIASQNGHAEVVNALLDGDAALDFANFHGATPLYIAAQNGHVVVVKALLEAGAIPEIPTSSGMTALAIAHQNAHSQVVNVLRRGGASNCLTSLSRRAPMSRMARSLLSRQPFAHMQAFVRV